MDMLIEMLQAQRDLQIKSFGKDPCTLSEAERALFIRWNQQALVAETFEMLDEVGWKEWASSRHINEEYASKEMTDAWHFFMNIMLAIHGPSVVDYGVAWLAERFARNYTNKNAVNAKRQVDGYDGIAGKCTSCKRDLAEVEFSTITNASGLTAKACQCGYPLPTLLS